MSYAILRVEKIKTAQQGAAKTAHNYRLRETPNADIERKPLNEEYINTTKRNYWELATERIQEVGAKVRPDSVRGMEIILTASPEAFTRDEQGQAADMRNSKWEKANIAFLQAKFGKENVVAMTLHQDELTPHFQAVVVPITKDGRLSAKDLFNPKTLRELQTEYAQAMKPFGLERGVEHSRAKHEVMRHVYGAQERSRGEVGELATPAAPTRLSIEGPGPLDLVNLAKWKAEQEAKLNAELARQLAATNERAAKAAQIAQDSSTAKDRAKTLTRQLASVEGTKTKEIEGRQRYENAFTRTAVRVLQGEPLSEKTLAHARLVRAEQQIKLEEQVMQILRKPIRKLEDVVQHLKALPGYKPQEDPNTGRIEHLRHQTTGSRFAVRELKPGGIPFKEAYEKAVVRTQQHDQAQIRQQNRGHDGGLTR